MGGSPEEPPRPHGARALTRQKLLGIVRQDLDSVRGLMQGAYVISDPKDSEPDLILMATGSEVHVAVEAAKMLEENGARPRVELPEPRSSSGSQGHRDRILPPNIQNRV